MQRVRNRTAAATLWQAGRFRQTRSRVQIPLSTICSEQLFIVSPEARKQRKRYKGSTKVQREGPISKLETLQSSVTRFG